MPSTIIVPFAHPDQDPGRIAMRAVPTARMLAELTGGSVLLASAVDILPRFDPLARRLVTPSESMKDSLLEETAAALREVASRFGDLPVELAVR